MNESLSDMDIDITPATEMIEEDDSWMDNNADLTKKAKKNKKNKKK